MKVGFKLSIVIVVFAFFSCQKEEKKIENIVYQSRDYNIYMGGKLAGYQKSSKDQDGSYIYSYEFNDRGRGPHIEEKVVLNENNVIIDHTIIGHNYLKDSVSEIFTIQNGIAKWKSNSEQGEAKFDNNSFFSAINTSFGTTDLLVKKLLSVENNEVDLLPSGTIKITGIDHHKINDSINLRLIEFTGQSFTPSYTWIDDDDRFFGYTSSWFTCIQKGYDSIAKQLLPIQKQKEKQYLKNLSTSLVKNPLKKILIKNVNIFDSESGKIIPNRSIILDKNKIEKISKTTPSEIDEYEVIDGSNKTLLPGLFDMHTHIDETDGILQLAAGITSVRDLGNSFDLPELKENFDTDKLIGPRILVMSGFIDKAGPYAGPTGSIINNLEEGIKAIENYHTKGYKQIKLYSSIEPKWVKPLADKAHELGMRVSGHIPAFMIAEQAVNEGYDEIQHANMLALNFLSDTIDTRTPLRFSMVADHNHKLDFSSNEFKNFIQLLKDKNIVIDPTISIFEGMFIAKAGDPNPSFTKILDRLPLKIQRGYYSGGLPIPEGKEEQYKASYIKLLEMVKQLYDNGVTIVAGTDSLAGFGLHTEMENYVKAGILPAEVLRITTSVSAKVSGVRDILGVIKEGYLADLILVDGNPVENISDIRKVELTIKDGNIYNPEKLYNAIGVKHFK
ncbi:amidohydrolase family protein [uncultured Aquimarina sp.]|uniref:amidohydrolase family protein n=1 Tax=uncultured Aquimarina sp. TaxID=575652 RepID=UPI0026396852|nr:amidohydrolase family protein [uncultured Aquimarina sp.]